MSEIRAIVFDSNVFGQHALPNVETVRLWAQACAAHDAELWIPEVVAYELAQHVIEAHRAFGEQHAAHRRRLEACGQPRGDQLPPIEVTDVMAAIREAGAVIVPLDDHSAREALMDQILLRGAGGRKRGVKTGAADSAWVRSVIAFNNGDPDGLIVVTGDTTALEATCDEMEIDEPRSVKHIGDVGHLLENSSIASPGRASEFAAWLQEYFVGQADPYVEGAYLTEIIDVGDYNWWDVEAVPADGHDAWELQDRTVSTVKEAKVLGDVEHDRWTDALAATVRLTAEVEEQYTRQDPSGDYVQSRARTYPGAIQAELRLFIENGELSHDGVLDELQLVPPASNDVVWTSV